MFFQKFYFSNHFYPKHCLWDQWKQNLSSFFSRQIGKQIFQKSPKAPKHFTRMTKILASQGCIWSIRRISIVHRGIRNAIWHKLTKLTIKAFFAMLSIGYVSCDDDGNLSKAFEILTLKNWFGFWFILLTTFSSVESIFYKKGGLKLWQLQNYFLFDSCLILIWLK